MKTTKDSYTKIDLTNFNKNKNLMDLAVDIVKYQDFKLKAALPRLRNGNNFSENTLRAYFDAGTSYIKKGKKISQCVGKLYEYIDDAISVHTQPLVPSITDRRRIVNRKETVKKPIKEDKVMALPKRLTEVFEYAVRVGNTIKIFATEELAAAFLDGAALAGVESKLIKLITEREKTDGVITVLSNV